MQVEVTRLSDGPIIGPELHPSIGLNIQGPSLIRVPEWVQAPLGRYYLYFADHKGSYIRLAYANALTGPWFIHPPGSLTLDQSGFPTKTLAVSDAEVARFEAQNRARGVMISDDMRAELATPHIASPDVHVDQANRRIVMYYHGLEEPGRQVSRAALSADGLAFTAQARGDRALLHAHLPALRHDLRAGDAGCAVALEEMGSAASRPAPLCSTPICATPPCWCETARCWCSGPRSARRLNGSR